MGSQVELTEVAIMLDLLPGEVVDRVLQFLDINDLNKLKATSRFYKAKCDRIIQLRLKQNFDRFVTRNSNFSKVANEYAIFKINPINGRIYEPAIFNKQFSLTKVE